MTKNQGFWVEIYKFQVQNYENYQNSRQCWLEYYQMNTYFVEFPYAYVLFPTPGMTQKNKPGKDMKSSIIRSYGYMPLCSSSKVVGRRRGIFVEGKRYRGSSSSYGRAHTRSVCRALLQFKLKSNCLIEWKGSDLSQEPRVILCPQLCHLIEEVIDVFILRLNLSVWPKVFFKKLGS